MLRLAIAVNDPEKRFLPSLISIFTRARAYHTELVFSDGEAIEITGKHLGWTTRTYDKYKWVVLDLPMIGMIDEAKIRTAANKLLASSPKYDYVGAIFGRFNNSAQDPSKWYCSEFCRTLLAPYIDGLEDDQRWITPDRLWREIAALLPPTQVKDL